MKAIGVIEDQNDRDRQEGKDYDGIHGVSGRGLEVKG